MPCFQLSIHWIAATTNESCTSVFVYDTLYTDFTHDIKQPITEMFGMLQVELVHGLQKQKGIKDCGVFAVAISTVLAYHYGTIHRFTFKAILAQNGLECHL